LVKDVLTLPSPKEGVLSTGALKLVFGVFEEDVEGGE